MYAPPSYPPTLLDTASLSRRSKSGGVLRAQGHRGMEIWSSGGMLPAGLDIQEVWRCAAGVTKKRYGDLEACCACRDV